MSIRKTWKFPVIYTISSQSELFEEKNLLVWHPICVTAWTHKSRIVWGTQQVDTPNCAREACASDETSRVFIGMRERRLPMTLPF